MKEHRKAIQNHFTFRMIKLFHKVKNDFFSQIDLFSHDFFFLLLIGPGRVRHGLLKQFKLDYHFSTKK